MGGIAVSLASIRLRNRANRTKEQRGNGKWDQVEHSNLDKVRRHHMVAHHDEWWLIMTKDCGSS